MTHLCDKCQAWRCDCYADAQPTPLPISTRTRRFRGASVLAFWIAAGAAVAWAGKCVTTQAVQIGAEKVSE